MKVNPFGGRRAERPVFTRTFEDEDRPDEPVTLSLCKLDTPDRGKLGDLIDRNLKLYVTGDEGEGTQPRPFPPVGGAPVDMTESLVLEVATVTIMQHPSDHTERYSFEELVGVSVGWQNAWLKILRAARNINKYGSLDVPDGEPVSKNGHGAMTTGECSASSSESSGPTTNSPFGSTPFSAASTTGPELSSVMPE